MSLQDSQISADVTYSALPDDHDQKKKICGMSPRRAKMCFGCTCCFFVFILILSIVGYYVIIPKVAQQNVDDASIVFNRIQITNPHDSYFHTHIEAEMSSAGPFDATIDPLDLTISYMGTNMGLVTLPEMAVKANEPTKIMSDSKFHVTNNRTFNNFNWHLIRNSTVSWRLQGKITLTVHKFGMNIKLSDLTFDKEIPLEGLDGMKQMEVISTDLTKSNDKQIIALMTVNIFNPAPVEMEPVGDLTFDVSYQGLAMGKLLSKNTNIYRGNNYMNLTGLMTPEKSDDPRAEKAFSRLLAGKPVVLTATASDDTIPLYRKALTGLRVDTAVTLPAEQLVESIEIVHAKMSMFVHDQNHMELAMLVKVAVNNPLGENCPFNVKQAGMHVTLMDSQNRKIGVTTTPPVNVEGGDKPVIQFEVASKVQIIDFEAFTDFAIDWIQNDIVKVRMRGSTTVSLDTVAGPMTLSGMPVDVGTTLQGLSNFTYLEAQILDIKVKGGKNGELLASTTLSLVDSSNIGLDLGEGSNLKLQMIDLKTGSIIGEAVVPHFTLDPGVNTNTYDVKMIRHPDATPNALENLLSAYVMGIDSRIGIRTLAPYPSVYTHLNKGLSLFKADTILKGRADKLLLEAYMHGTKVNLFKKTLQSGLLGYNPFDAECEITGADTKIFLSKTNETIGYFKQDLHDEPIVIPPKSQKVTRNVVVKFVLGWSAFKSVFQRGGIPLGVDGHLTVRFGGKGGFEATIYYRQLGLKGFLKF